MERDPLQAALTGVIAAVVSFVVALVAVLFVRLFTDDPETQILVAMLVWPVAFGGFLWAQLRNEPG